MTRINETNVNLFDFSRRLEDAFDSVANLFQDAEGEQLPDVLSGNSDNYKTRLLFDREGYWQASLNENLGVGGTQQVSADSTPEELLRDPRVRAMLDAIAYAEGTRGNGDYGRVVNGTVLGPSDRNAPYDESLVGRRNVVVDDFSRHPNLAVRWANGQPPSSAAGRYQFLYSTWQGLNMPDFSPRSQDLAAIKLMQRRGMIEPLLRGDFAEAIHRGAPEWASLPVEGGGSYYGGQGARSLSSLREVYNNALRQYQGNETPNETPTAPNPTPSNPATGGTLQRGENGRAVEALQDRLIRLGLMTEAQQRTGPGIFGPKTEAAVKAFQRSVGLNPSGRFDNATRSAMNKIFSGDIERGARGSIVRQMQEKLVRLGYMTRAQVNTGPGIFGPKTEAALRRFQAEHGLTRDGIYGPNTFRALQNATPRTNGNNQQTEPPVGDGEVQEYRRWNVYSTGNRPARQADGYEDLQAHHDYQTVNYVMRGLRLNRRLEARDIVLTRPGQSNFGQAVPSPLEGTVLFAGNENDGYGNKVVMRNDRTGEIMMVGHLQSVNVRTGDNVAYGQNLGGQGSTGHSTGAHVHINADPAVIRRWVADLADGRFDGARGRFDVGQRP
ncbi:MAG TPA: peptidoglycan-binding protein [Pyrinomonadaceae bacterium]|jgi:peptidoglycan hydrolase-like protein with peptidoglycan-binding domain/muramidase (phage lysozyme)